jgi:hypothetical protein
MLRATRAAPLWLGLALAVAGCGQFGAGDPSATPVEITASTVVLEVPGMV